MEPRARAGKNVGKMNFGYGELRQLLYGCGDAREPLPETMRILDEIATDFIQSLSFEAARMAHYAGRQKIKYEDFEFALRRNPLFLGKVREMFEMSKEVKEARKMPGIGEGNIGKAEINDLVKLGDGEDKDEKGGGDKNNDDATSKVDGRSSVTANGSRKRGSRPADDNEADGAGSGSGSGNKKKKIKLAQPENGASGAANGGEAEGEATQDGGALPDDDDDIFGDFDGAADHGSSAPAKGAAENGGDLAELDDDIDSEMR